MEKFVARERELAELEKMYDRPKRDSFGYFFAKKVKITPWPFYPIHLYY